MEPVAALGRPFTLGMLYDARKHELIPGITLWDDNTFQANIQENSQQSSQYNICASDSIMEKASLLEIDASLKASFLGGHIKVEGSARYLNDHKEFQNQSRVTLMYKATTTFKQLQIPHRGMKNMQDVIKKGLATHVVTAILYGANAYFVFDSEKLEASRVKDIQGSMEAMIDKISFDLGMKAKIHLTEQEKALTKKLSCKFYGDFHLDRNILTFEEAVETCFQLPRLLGQKKENAVPVKVWLMPLKTFAPEAAQVMNEISFELMHEVEKAVEEVREMEKRCNDALVDKVVKKFPQVQEKLKSFQELCHSHRSTLQATIAMKLPSIRAGKEPESSLKKYFEKREKSPFSHDKLSKWMDHKEREINIIRVCVDTMEGTETKIVSNKNELDKEVLAQSVDDALCFAFTSLEKDDPYLDVMANYLGSSKLGSTKEDQWYFSDEVLTKMRQKARAFHGLAKALKNNRQFCFLVAVIPNKKYKGATIYHYKEGNLVTDNFTKPVIPDVTAVKDRRNLIWYACDLTLDPNTANNYLTLSKGNKMATCGSWQTYPDHPDRFDTHVQVLCREKLSGRHYWEVEWSNGNNDEVGVAVTYKGICRKGNGPLSRLGHNAQSWYFGHRYGLYAWHDAKEHCGPLPHGDCRRVGVYLDWPAGTLSFYRVSSNRLRHLYTFRTKFTEPVYPGFWVWVSCNSVILCPFE